MPSLINAAVPVFEPGADDVPPPAGVINRAVPIAPPPSQADAWDVTGPAVAQNARDAWAAVKDPQTWRDAANQYRMAMLLGSIAPGEGSILAYHGSPHSFDRFDMSRIGTGEGNQAYGQGLYFAGNEGVARYYRDALSSGEAKATGVSRAASDWLDDLNRSMPGVKLDDVREAAQQMYDPWDVEHPNSVISNEIQTALDEGRIKIDSAGHMYQVNIAANPEHMLDWDRPLSEQSQHVQDALGQTSYLYHADRMGLRNPTGGQLIREVIGDHPDGVAALRDVGIPGIRYLDQSSRAAGEGSHNFVVFDDNLISVLKKYGIAGLLGGGGAAGLATGGDNSQ
jgi:hypothetical protein